MTRRALAALALVTAACAPAAPHTRVKTDDTTTTALDVPPAPEVTEEELALVHLDLDRQARERASRSRGREVTASDHATPAPVLIPPTVEMADVEDTICAHFGDVCDQAIRVARCESGLRPDATNGPHRGLFQINVSIHEARIARHGYTADHMLEAGPNAAVAADLFREQGWRPWTCQP